MESNDHDSETDVEEPDDDQEEHGARDADLRGSDTSEEGVSRPILTDSKQNDFENERRDDQEEIINADDSTECLEEETRVEAPADDPEIESGENEPAEDLEAVVEENDQDVSKEVVDDRDATQLAHTLVRYTVSGHTVDIADQSTHHEVASDQVTAQIAPAEVDAAYGKTGNCVNDPVPLTFATTVTWIPL